MEQKQGIPSIGELLQIRNGFCGETDSGGPGLGPLFRTGPILSRAGIEAKCGTLSLKNTKNSTYSIGPPVGSFKALSPGAIITGIQLDISKKRKLIVFT